MKMMRKNWKDRKGVSPVIATILMVAITVVLAAVLYVMVMGFGGDDQSSITGTFTTKEKIGDAERIRFGALSPSVDGSKISLRVDVTGPSTSDADSATFKWDENKWTTTDPMDAGPLSGITSIAFDDLAKDNKISSGDYITITHATGGDEAEDTSYTITVSMLNAASGALIDSIEYSWVVVA